MIVDKRSARGLIGAMRRTLVVSVVLLASAPALALTGNAPLATSARHEVMLVGSHGTSCTGTAIARDLVLTAGHCIEPGTTYKVVEMDAGQPHLLDVRSTVRHPQFKPQSLSAPRATADVALLKMAAPLPASITPAALGQPAATPQVGETLSVIGYGLTVRDDGRTGGKRREARLAVTGQPGSLQIRLFDPATKGTRPGLGACTGDSGAPAYAGSVLIGVVSWSTGPNLSDGCGGLTGITPLMNYRQWISDAAKKLGSPLAP